jgi:hypothetical protein
MTDWSRYDIPEHVCELQKAWDRRHRIMVAINGGAKIKDIAAYLGISRHRVWGLNDKARFEWGRKLKSPVDAFLSRRDFSRPPKPKTGKAIDRLASGRDWLHI